MTNLTHWTPQAELPSLSRDPFFGRFFNLMNLEPEETGQWLPAMNLRETKDELIATLDIPGIDPKTLDISLDADRLTIRGERKKVEEEKESKFLRHEVSYGRFQRTLQLPMHVEADKVRAKANHGVMTIHMPKAPDSVGRQIPVEAE